MRHATRHRVSLSMREYQMIAAKTAAPDAPLFLAMFLFGRLPRADRFGKCANFDKDALRSLRSTCTRPAIRVPLYPWMTLNSG